MSSIRRGILGSYAIIMKKNNTVYVFVDENHTYNLYYYHQNNEFIITNTYYHIANQVNESFVLENMIDKICGCYFVDNQTPFTNIYKLMGNQYIQYNVDSGVFNLKDLQQNSYPLESTDFHNSIAEMSNRILSITKVISDLTEKITIFGTGGLDSRLVLAGFMGTGVKPDVG